MCRPYQLTLFLSLVLGAMSSACAELPKGYQVNLQTDNFPPFSMDAYLKNFARGDDVQGISADTVREIFKRAGIAYTLTLRGPLDRIYKQTLQVADYGLFSIPRNDQNRTLFKWVGPLAHYDGVLLAAPGKKLEIANLAQAKGYKIGAYRSGGVSDYLESQGLKPIDSLNDDDNIRKLLNGEIDLWATADPVWRYYAEQQGAEGLQTALSFATTKVYLALNKDTPDEAVERLQKAMNAVISEGYNGCSKTPDLCYLIRDRSPE